MFAKKNFEKGRKNLSYCFRFIEFGFQLGQFGRIKDTTAANEMVRSILESKEENWRNLENFEKTRNEKVEEFSLYVPHRDFVATSSNEEKLLLLEFLKSHSLKKLTRYFGIF